MSVFAMVASLLCKLIRAAGLLYVKDTPPGFLSQYLPSRSFKIAASLVCGLDKKNGSTSVEPFLFALRRPECAVLRNGKLPKGAFS